jgi:hypothetical protein
MGSGSDARWLGGSHKEKAHTDKRDEDQNPGPQSLTFGQVHWIYSLGLGAEMLGGWMVDV